MNTAVHLCTYVQTHQNHVDYLYISDGKEWFQIKQSIIHLDGKEWFQIKQSIIHLQQCCHTLKQDC